MRAVLCAALMIVAVTSCDKQIYEGLEPCPNGIRLRFVYDYNMEYANSFHKKVDCVTLYVYDGQGNFVGSYVETTEVLADENYRMTLDLPHGAYRLVAYGGLACPEHSFSVVTPPTAGTRASMRTDLRVQMDEGELGTCLHDLYYGALDVTVDGDDYVEATLPLIKDTNNLRIILQQLNSKPVDCDNFDFSIVDDNTLFAHDNSLLPNGEVTYCPWVKGNATAGTVGEGDAAYDLVVGYAEFSTSRLTTTNRPHLIIRNRELDKEIVNIPLIDYLLLLKSDLYTQMPAQEFLDRESEWALLFFIDKGEWVRTQIIINDWVVRLNNAEL